MALSYTSVDKMLDIEPMIGSVSDLTSAHLAKFAEHAESEINGKIARYYSVPVPNGPPLLEAVATSLSLYLVLSQRIFTQERLRDSDWPDAFKEARDLLDEIASNDILLVSSTGAIVGQRTDEAEIKTTTEGYNQTFWEGPRTEQVQDPDKIEDLGDERDLNIDVIRR